MTLEAFLDMLDGVGRSAAGHSAKCPAHEDRNPSLSVSQGDDGRILLNCHAGCTSTEIVESLGLQMSDLFPETGHPRTGKTQSPSRSTQRCKRGKLHKTPEEAAGAAAYGLKRKLGKPYEAVASWPYHGPTGEEVGRVYRFENPEEGRASKQYRPIYRDGAGWRIGDPPTGFPLYHLPAVRECHGRVFVVEGEKAADILIELGLTATTSAHGAKSAHKADWSPLSGFDVFLLADNDPPRPDGTSTGMDYVETAAQCLRDLKPPANPHLLELPDLPPKGDAVEFVEARRKAGKTDGEIREEIEMLAASAPEYEPSVKKGNPEKSLPKVFLPGGARNIRITDAATALGKLFSEVETLFERGDSVVQVRMDSEVGAVLEPVRPEALTSIFESVADLYTTRKKPDSVVEVPRNCSKVSAEFIVSCSAFIERLPQLRLLTRCPVLVEYEDQLVTISGYHRPTGIYAVGGAVEEVSLNDARHLLDDMLQDFRFASPSDRSRALAGLITPALIHGGLLGARAPLDLGEANESQTGKGYRARLNAAVYNDTPRTITQRHGGVGSVEESFSVALIQGDAFISLDNIRGKLESPAIESALTEDSFLARAPYSSPTTVDMRRITVMLTSNRAELTQDLANRSSPVLLRKQPEGYAFKSYPGGANILEHVQQNQGRYLGAIFAVARAWWEAGCPHTEEARHDFRAWAQALDWIVQHLLGAAPLCDGLKEVKVRMTTPALGWLREVALYVIQGEQSGEWLRASSIIDILDAHGAEIPGLPEDGDLADSDTRKGALQAVGRRLAQCFRTAIHRRVEDAEIAVLTIDETWVERREEYDEALRYHTKSYRFVAAAMESGPIAAAPQNDSVQLSTMEQTLQSDTVGNSDCGYAAAKGAAMESAMETPAAANAADRSEHIEGSVSTVKSDSQDIAFEKRMGSIAAQPQEAHQEPKLLDEPGPPEGEVVTSGASPEREVFEL